MLGRSKRHKNGNGEKRELAKVKARLDRLEPRVTLIETRLRVMRRETT